ncbi:non-ribosomal peptide synthetase [Actinoplanes subglobosus]|uniref:Amino acid adenylation domain-containing protein n=1 Tax=Actinoplanes subglobosus TaxID=1547892 RepID=A0ABV8J892_9ACTN
MFTENAGRLPLSFAQQALWLLDRLHPGSPEYHVPVAVRLRGELDVEALRRALTRVADRHEVLRTVYPTADGTPYQQVLPAEEVSLAVLDAAGSVDEWAARPFDLARDRPLRAALVQTSDDDYLLVVVLHHIACDGESMHLFFDELGRFYAGDDEPEPLTARFADHAIEQRSAGVAEDGVGWWREHLAGAPTSLALPTDHRRPAVRTGRGATHTDRLPKDLVAEVSVLARRLRTSPFVVLTAAYAALLGRLTGTREVLVGTPVEGRDDPRFEPLIGFFVNTVPLRVDLSGDPGFDELIRRVRWSTLDAVEHAAVPFDALVRALRLERDPASVPLVQALLTFESRPFAELRLPGVEAEVRPMFTGTAKFDLDVMIVRAPGGGGDFDLSVTYNTDLFEAATAAAFAERLLGVVAAGVADPTVPLHRLPVLTAAEAAPVPADAPGDRPPVTDWIRRHAVTRRTDPAVDSPAGTLSYAELDQRADALAGRLIGAGAEAGDVIGILLPRGPSLVTAMAGVLRSGAAYLPLDLVHPRDHLRRVLTAAGVRWVITDDGNAARLDGLGVEPVRAESEDGHPARYAHPHPDDLAYVIFTSGSTGEPKGVGVPHRALANHALAIRDAFALQPGDRVLQLANAAFDVAAEEIFPTWAAGACVVLCEHPPAPERLTGLLDERGITVANLPSSYWQRWTAAIAQGEAPLPGTLRLLVIGSEPVDPSALRAWQTVSDVPVINAYGLTETTITSLTHPLPVPAGGTVPVGTPIAGVRAYVLDDHLNRVPAGVTGELYIGGAGLARGYLGRPDLTAARFLPDPFAATPGSRMHRTGDLARRRGDGTVELLGRADAQLKIRGHRIEPGDVESGICTHADVIQAAVAARPGPDGTARLAAYVVTRSGTVPDDLRRHLSALIPAYLIPDSFTCLPLLPALPSGKVDRTALPQPQPPVTRRIGRTEAGTATERLLAAVWRDVLDLGEVGPDDNFFDLGGTSYTLATVHARLGEHFDGLPLIALYEHPTIAALAEHLTCSDDGERTVGGGDAESRHAGRSRLHQRRLQRR